jgi:hypothetical protein
MFSYELNLGLVFSLVGSRVFHKGKKNNSYKIIKRMKFYKTQ